MSHTVFYALTIYGVGCVIPTPLDRQPTPTNYAPSIDTVLTSPALGPINRSADSAWAWHIVATDPNVDDILYAQIAERVSDSVSANAITVPLSKQPHLNSNDPARWSGDTSPNRWCGLYGPGIHYLYVYVADSPFVPNADMFNPFATEGLIDSNHWELTCS